MKRAMAVLTALTAPLAATAGALSGTSMHSAPPQARAADPRTAVAATAASEIAALNTFTADTAPADVRHWLDATAGSLRDDIAASAAATADRIAADGASAHGAVTGLAFVSFDGPAATAHVIAAVRVEVVAKGGAATSDRRRLAADLVRTAGGWRVTSLTAIPAGSPRSSLGTDPVLAYTATTLGKIFSYGPDTPPSVSPDLEGVAADQYRSIADSLAAQIRSQDLTLTTHVVAAGVTSQDSDTARVLAFIDQTSTRHGGTPTVAAGAVAVTLRLRDGRWRIVSLNAE